MELEKQIIELIAMDRIDKPISSMSGKLKRRKPKLAKEISLPRKSYKTDRVWAKYDNGDHEKARGTKEGIEKFVKNFPKYGKILNGYIAEERTVREKYLVFGMRPEAKINTKDYMGVMDSLGFGENISKRLYPELMDISRSLSKKREETERSILIEQNY